MQGLILAAGMGKRLKQYTDRKPKVLIEVHEICLLTNAFHSWNLIVCADTFLPFHFCHKDAPAIYINHGLHIISLDGGDNLYAYAHIFRLLSVLHGYCYIE